MRSMASPVRICEAVTQHLRRWRDQCWVSLRSTQPTDFTLYNWTRIHSTLRVTPAMAAGITDRVWSVEEIVGLMDAEAPKPGRPKTYKKRPAPMR
jgi:hypothetical protein